MAIATNSQLILSSLPPRLNPPLSLLLPTTLPFSLLRHRSLRFRASFSFKSPTSTLRPFSDADDEDEQVEVEEDDEDYDEEEEEEEDEDVAADEYDDVVSGEVPDEGEAFEVANDALARHEGFKWQRVEKLCNEVREFGAEIIDVDELASVYDFRIDKFQVPRFFLSSFRFSFLFVCLFVLENKIKFRIRVLIRERLWFWFSAAAGDSSFSERFFGGGFRSDEQREDFDCRSCGGCHGG